MAATNPGSSENRLQSFIHSVEQGDHAGLVRKFLFGAAIVVVALLYPYLNFRGFSIPEAMDQAQIGRQIATGHGWTTQLIRPLAIWQLTAHTGAPPKGDLPDTFNAPLPPLLDALAVKMTGPDIVFKQSESIAPVERIIVALSILCFLLAALVQFFTLRRLFDARLASWAVVLTLLSNLCWQFTLSGLPQMLMLLLFNLALYALLRAVEVNVRLQASAAGQPAIDEAGNPLPARTASVLLWLALAGALFGLLALSHGLAAWYFLGLVIFAGFYFRQRGPVLLVLLAAFGMVYAPWLVRNYQVSGSPFGLAGYGIFEGLNNQTTIARMRSPDGPALEGIAPRVYRVKIENGVVDALENLLRNLGTNLIALAFFLGLLHVFRRREVGAMRMAVLLMWLVGLVGIAGTRIHSDAPDGVGPDQLDVLFLPIMLGIGLAFVLVLFGRREGNTGVLGRLILFSVLVIISGLPMLFALLPRGLSPIQYPPYYEPAINRLAQWTTNDEIIASDMPWAVAWYANRKSLWIPPKPAELMSLSDNGQLSGPLAGIFLTPISRNVPFLSAIYKGEYKDYGPVLAGRFDLPPLPFHEVVTPMGDLSYSFSSDSKRWIKSAPKTGSASR